MSFLILRLAAGWRVIIIIFMRRVEQNEAKNTSVHRARGIELRAQLSYDILPDQENLFNSLKI